MNVDIGATDHCDKRRVTKDVTAALDKPFITEIHDVAGHRGTAYPQLRRYGLLRRHGVIPDECKNLLFAVSHIQHMLVEQTYVRKSSLDEVEQYRQNESLNDAQENHASQYFQQCHEIPLVKDQS